MHSVSQLTTHTPNLMEGREWWGGACYVQHTTYRAPGCPSCPSGCPKSPVSVLVSIYNSAKENLAFVVRKQKLTSESIFISSWAYSFMLLSKAYMNTLFKTKML